MFRMSTFFITSAIVSTVVLSASLSFAQTTRHETYTESPDGTSSRKTVTVNTPRGENVHTQWTTDQYGTDLPTSARLVHFLDFDLNNDKVLSMGEIGRMLFQLYDTDQNEIIDNIEFERRSIITVVSMAKDSVISYDLDGDGQADRTKYIYETFIRDTMLTKFDKNRDRLSPHEFMDITFSQSDVNNDRVIDISEWQGSYIPTLDKKNKDEARYNN